MTRRLGATMLAAALAVALPLAGPASAQAPDDPAEEPGDPADELPDGARTIIGSPDPGPEPEDAGDRGGWAQLLLLGALVTAVGVIGWRVGRAVRAGPTSSAPT